MHQEPVPRRHLRNELRPHLTTTAACSVAAIATQLADHELVTAAQGGDRGALDQLLRRHYDRVHAVCRRITGHEADAADAAQGAMIAIVRNLDRFDGRSSFGTWVYRIATNASLDELRRRKRRPVPTSDETMTIRMPSWSIPTAIAVSTRSAITWRSIWRCVR